MIYRDDVPRDKVWCGADPDTHNVSYALLHEGEVLIFLIKVPGVVARKKIKGLGAAAFLWKMLSYMSSSYMGGEQAEADGAFYIEAQSIAHARRKKEVRPQDLVTLATVAGAMGHVSMMVGLSPQYVMPVSWKGSIKKHIHQARICTHMGWKYKKSGEKVSPINADYSCVKVHFSRGKLQIDEDHTLLDTEWKHVLDSVGLALYAAEQGK